MSLKERLQHNRPDLKPQTLYSYCSTLSSLYKKVFNSNDIELDKFDEADKILAELANKAPSTRKTTLAILYVLTGNKKYQTQMSEDIQTYKEDTSKQEMNEKQKEAFVSQDEIRNLLSSLKDNATLLYKKKNLTTKDKQEIQQYIILCLTSGVYIPPRRALDWTAFRIRNATADSNYIEKNNFVFNTYKGSAQKGRQTIPIPKELKTILNKWITVNEADYLLVDANSNPLTSVKLNQRLVKLFGTKTGINGLRHSYLSTKFQDSIKQQHELSETMAAMGSSTGQSQVYIQQLPAK